MFLVCGTATSAWAPMVPFAKAGLRLDDATLGLILLALGGGSIVAMPLAGAATHRWGSRVVIVAAGLLACGVLPLLTVPPSPLALAATLFLFGAGLGALDVAMNAQAIAVQHAVGRPIMSAFHGLFSVGGLVGALVVGLLLHAGLTLFSAAAAVAALLAALVVAEQRRLLVHHGSAGTVTFAVVASPPVLFIGALCFISFLAEGAVLDWSAVFLRELHGVDLAMAGMAYAVFSISMAAGRLTGDRLTGRFGTQRMLQAGGIVAAAGFLAVAALPWTAGSLAGFIVVGIGAANIVPVLFSAAGRAPGVPSAIALATVTTIAYAGLLLGPALLGFVAHATSLQTAFVLVAAMLALVPLGAKLVP